MVRGDQKKDQWFSRENMETTPSRYRDYKSVNISKEHIIQECINTMFCEKEVKFPEKVYECPDLDKSQHCHFRKMWEITT